MEYRKFTLLNFRREFFDKLLEQKYQRFKRKNIFSRNRTFTILTACVLLLVFPSDFVLLRNNHPIFFLLFLRASGFLLTMVFFSHYLDKKSYLWGKRITTAWIVLFTTIILIITYTRPSGYYLNLVTDSLFIIAIYVFIQISFLEQVITALLFTLLDLNLFFIHRGPLPSLTALAILLLFFVVNFAGIFLCWNFHTNSRREFYLLLKERQVSRELKRTRNKIKLLNGLIPICSACKKNQG